MAEVADLLAAYDAQLRARTPDSLPEGVTVERDGPLLRFVGLFGPGGGGFVSYRALGDIDGAELDDLIARQVRAFAARKQRFEWKTHGHDRPVDLPERLSAAGFVPEEEETVVIARVEEIASEPQLPEDVTLREVTERHDFKRIAGLERAVWGEDGQDSWLVNMLDTERSADPDSITIIVAEAAEAVVCAGWIRFERNTDFATLWGGSTLPEWRRRGIYRATVAYRANLARERGFRFLEVDASSDSRPILERLGFIPVTTTTPYIWKPPRD